MSGRSLRSICGSPTVVIPASVTASSYQPGMPAAHGLVEHRLAADLLDHHLWGHLPAAEARHLQLPPDRLGGAAHLALERVARDLHLEAHARVVRARWWWSSGLRPYGAEDSVAVCPASAAAPWSALSAWAVTGPPGHAWSALADIAVFWARWAASAHAGRARAGGRGAAGSASSPPGPCPRASGCAAAPRARGGSGLERLSACPITLRVRDAVAPLQRAREPQRGPQLPRGCRAPARRSCPTCSMPIAVQLRPTVCRHMIARGHEPVDGPVAVDHVVRADAGQLAQLHVGRVGGEGVEHGREACRWRCSARRSRAGGGAGSRRCRSGVARRRASRAGGSAPNGIGRLTTRLRRDGPGERQRRPACRRDVASPEGVPPGSSTTKAVSPREAVVLPAGGGAVVAAAGAGAGARSARE